MRRNRTDMLGRHRLAVLFHRLGDASLDRLDRFVRGLHRKLGHLGGTGERHVECGAREAGLHFEHVLHRLDAGERLHIGEARLGRSLAIGRDFIGERFEALGGDVGAGEAGVEALLGECRRLVELADRLREGLLDLLARESRALVEALYGGVAAGLVELLCCVLPALKSFTPSLGSFERGSICRGGTW